MYGKPHAVIDGHKRTGELMPELTAYGPAAPAGLTRYASRVFGDEYRDNFFAAMFNLHKVTRHVLEPSGATFKSRDSDFLVSNSRDFHPTDVLEDADGSLLVIDTGAVVQAVLSHVAARQAGRARRDLSRPPEGRARRERPARAQRSRGTR